MQNDFKTNKTILNILNNEFIQFRRKTALIKGGVHGLGMAMAEGLAKAGAELIITNNTQEPLDDAIAHYRKSGFTATGYVFDVTKEIDAEKQVASMIEKHGKIDILVNNAGIILRVLVIDMEVSDFRKVIV